jgi:hypothetical protein
MFRRIEATLRSDSPSHEAICRPRSWLSGKPLLPQRGVRSSGKIMKTILSRLLQGIFAVSLTTAGLCGNAMAQSASALSSQAGPRVRITQAINDTQLVTLHGNVHPLARPEFDQGAVATSQPMNRMLLLLKRSAEQEAALRKLLEEQQTTTSPSFHRWLTPEEFGKLFGPADADIQAVTNWLSSQGFQNIKVAAGRTAIEFSGNAGTVQSAFHTAIHKFDVRGKLRQANVSDPEIPAALTPVVAGIVSLNNFPRRSYRHLGGAYKQEANGRVVPQFTGGSGSNQFFAVGPTDFSIIYNTQPLLNGGNDGTGVTIGVVGISNIDIQDVRDFRTLFGLPANDPNIVLNGPDPGLNGAEGEAALDVQWSGAVAPGATINLVVSEDTLTASGVDLSAFYVIDNNSADILSVSFGACEASLGSAGNQFFNALWEQAAAQGITVLVAAGDPGSAGCDDFTTETRASLGLAVNGLASTPFNIAVGGTDFDDVGRQTPTFWSTTNSTDGKRSSALGYIPESTWNDSCAGTAAAGTLTTCVGATASLLNIVGGSGGPSAVNAKPSWQTALTPADGFRDTPDISLFASDGPSSNSFYVECQADALPSSSPPSCNASSGSFSFFSVGGTSASTPAVAGIIALVNQALGGRQGNANVTLYKIAAGENFSNCNSTTAPLTGSSCSFYDVTKGNNSVPCVGGSPNCSSTNSTTNGVLVDPAHTNTPAWIAGAVYDYATGLGTVNAQNLVNAWVAAAATFRPTSSTLAANGSTTITHGQSVSFTATVTPTTGTGTPTGDVALVGPNGVPNSAGNGNRLSGGTTTITSSSLPGGTHSFKAHYAGDSTFAPSDSNSISVSVSPENSRLQMGIVTFSLTTGSITSTNATTFEYGSPYILRMDILNGSGNPCQPLASNGSIAGCAFDATGSITLTDNGSPLDGGTFGINSEGHAEDQPIQLPAGAHNLSASYSGDASYNPSSPVTATLTVTPATTATAVTASPLAIVSGGTVTLTATVSSNSNSAQGPTGTVQFLNGGGNLGAAVTCTPAGATNNAGASCTAKLTTALSALPPGFLEPPARVSPPIVLIWLAAVLALICLALAMRLAGRRRVFAYAGFALFAVVSAGLAGCGGGSGGTTSRTVTVSAKYSGDTNYAASTASGTTVTIQ